MNPTRLFHSCTAALSHRAIGRPARHVLAHPRVGFRLYSTQQDQERTEKTEEAEPAVQLEKLKEKETKVSELTNKLLYLQADFINLQRNATREKEQQRDYAITRFAGDLLEVVDVLNLALKSVPNSLLKPTSHPSSSSTTDSSAPQKSAQDYLIELHQGVEMTHRLLLSTLAKYSVKPFDPTGEKFDPNRHEALYQAPVPGKEPGTVLECQKIGYVIKDRLLRAAQVGVVQDTS
ncbi:GrpE nucleotide exchange factor [Scleroderma yunnanense]